MIIITKCFYTYLALHNLTKEIASITKNCLGKTILFDAKTASLISYARKIGREDRVLVFSQNISGKQETPGYIRAPVYYVNNKRNMDDIRRDINIGLKILISKNRTEGGYNRSLAPVHFTKKEQQVLNLLYLGFEVKKISQIMNVTDKTVYTWIGNLKKKLKLKRFVDLLHLLYEFGPKHLQEINSNKHI